MNEVCKITKNSLISVCWVQNVSYAGIPLHYVSIENAVVEQLS